MYDEAMVVSCLQGIINREGPSIYVISQSHPNPSFWLQKLTTAGRWLQGTKIDTLNSLDELFYLARNQIK